jgi:uncharacterized protein (TIGR02145 family)
MKISYKILLIAVLLITEPVLLFAQNLGINDDGSSPDSSAIVDVKSTSKGLLIPRMTSAQIGAIINPANGLQVYCTTDNKMYIYVAAYSVWKEVAYGTTTILPGGGPTCGQNLTDNRNGTTFNTILIGTQCWMKQNLNVGTMISSSVSQSNNGILEKYCYGDIASNCDVYGGLYQWNEMMKYGSAEGIKGICPDGWHLPTVSEFTTLAMYLGGGALAGGKMKEPGYLHWVAPNAGASNSSGFTALPGGIYVFENQGFSGINNTCFLWTSTQHDMNNSWYQALGSSYEYMGQYYFTKTSGYSVRCIMD